MFEQKVFWHKLILQANSGCVRERARQREGWREREGVRERWGERERERERGLERERGREGGLERERGRERGLEREGRSKCCPTCPKPDPNSIFDDKQKSYSRLSEAQDTKLIRKQFLASPSTHDASRDLIFKQNEMPYKQAFDSFCRSYGHRNISAEKYFFILALT